MTPLILFKIKILFQFLFNKKLGFPDFLFFCLPHPTFQMEFVKQFSVDYKPFPVLVSILFKMCFVFKPTFLEFTINRPALRDKLPFLRSLITLVHIIRKCWVMDTRNLLGVRVLVGVLNVVHVR